jgi:hypothetical protein
MTERWETVEEINAARERFEAALGWKRPAAWGLVTRDGDVLRANFETGYLPAVTVATVLGHTGGSAELPLSVADAEAAIALGEPAEACTDIPHPNIAALRVLVAGGTGAVAVFVDEADLVADFGAEQTHLRALMDEVRRGREENPDGTTTLYRPVGPKELALLRESGFTAWPPRLPDQPIFYPVFNEGYAADIARQWNVGASGSGHVTRFRVRTDFARRYPTQQAGGADKLELWIPADDVDAVNRALAGPIEVIADFGPR